MPLEYACIIANCNRARLARGLCNSCYRAAKLAVARGEETWESLEAMGLAKGSGGPKPPRGPFEMARQDAKKSQQEEPPPMSQTSNGHPLDLKDPEQTSDAESDAAGFIATVAKNQAVLFTELQVDCGDVIAEVDGDYVSIEFPRVTARVKREKYADFMAKEAADSFYLFAKAMFEDLRS